MVPFKSRIRAAFDGFRDPVTGRGSRFDRTRRLQGQGSSYADSELYSLYTANGFMQRIINAPADDATREWFEIEAADDEVARLIQERMKELKFKEKLRELIKYASIYPKGAGIFMGVFAANVRNQRALSEPMPDTILKIDFINLMADPGDFSIQAGWQKDATKRDFDEISFRIGSQNVHRSWVMWLVNEFNHRETAGISKVDTVYDAVSAQDSALWSVSTLMQVLSLLVFKSDEFVAMTPDKQSEFLKRARTWADSQAMMGMGTKEDLSRLETRFSGMKDMLEFIFQNMSGVSHIPVNILHGRAQGVLTAAEEDTINYYNGISRFQEGKVEPIARQLTDVIVRERRSPLWGLTGGKLEYGIKFNPLWELSPSLKAEIEKSNAERDSLDIQDAKASPEEARKLDPRYAMLDQESVVEEPPDDEEEGEEGGSPRPDDNDEAASLNVDGKKVAAGLIALDRSNIGGKFHRVQALAPRLFIHGTFRVRTLDSDKEIYAIDGRPRGRQVVTVQSVVFSKDKCTRKEAEKWVQDNITSRPGFDELKVGADRQIRFNKHNNSIIVIMHTWDEMATDVPHDDFPKTVDIDFDKGISGMRGKLRRSGKVVWMEVTFKENAWTAEMAETWVDLNLPDAASFVPPKANNKNKGAK